MKLYYSAGSCSTCCHLALEEAGLPHEAIQLDWGQPESPLFAEIAKRNPQGALPVVVDSQGRTLLQNIAILTHIADQKPEKKLLPPLGTWERAQAMSWLSFVASDLHKAFSPLFGLSSIASTEAGQAEVGKWAKGQVLELLQIMDTHLAGRQYLNGNDYTVADSYAFVVVGWCKWVGIEHTGMKNLNAYLARIYQRPATQKVLQIEGLLE